MNEAEAKGIAVVADAIGGLAGPVKTSFLKALSDLLGGLTAIPAAKLKQYAQGIEDTTAARSAVAAMVAKSAGESGLADPVLMQAAAEVYLPTALRKAKNRIGVALKAAEHVAEQADDHSSASAPEDDWMNAFTRFAEDASSEKLRDLFGRILAGQVVRPGSFSPATIRTVAELEQSIAADFELVWARGVGEAVDYSGDFQRGDWFSRCKRLAEAGLMAPQTTSQFLPDFYPAFNGNCLWSPIVTGRGHLVVHFAPNCSARWDHIDFTRTGRELGSLLTVPDYEENMRKAAKRLEQPGVARIDLNFFGKPMEILYEAMSPAGS